MDYAENHYYFRRAYNWKKLDIHDYYKNLNNNTFVQIYIYVY